MRTLIFIALLGAVLSCKTQETGQQIATFHPKSEHFWNVVPRDALAERIGINFQFTEGPAWYPDGTLIFSDIPQNTIFQWNGRRYDTLRTPSGNSNGLLVDPGWAVIACEHGSRSITRMSLEGELTTLADQYQGMRFNSPNDLCRRGDGSIYFTDPPWGLQGRNEDPEKEIPFNGVYRLHEGEVSLIDSSLSWPNGIALSPDEDYLYVANFEGGPGIPREQYEVFWMRYALDEAGNAGQGEVFFRSEDLELPGGPDGMKVDRKGNIFATGPGGILVISPEGEHLGTIELPESPTNLCFGPKERALYVTARSMVIRIWLKQNKKKEN